MTTLQKQKILTIWKRYKKQYNLHVKLYIVEESIQGNAGQYNRQNNSITLFLNGIKDLYKKGGTDWYYIGRADYINKHFKNNLRRTIKFILLHEIGHSLYTVENWIEDEKIADIFAIQTLTK